MSSFIYKKKFYATDILTASKGTWVTAIDIDLSEDFPVNLGGANDVQLHIEVIDVYWDTVNGLAGASNHGSARWLVSIARESAGNILPFAEAEIARSGGFDANDNNIRTLPTSITAQDTFQIQVESSTGNDDLRHFVIAEVTAYLVDP